MADIVQSLFGITPELYQQSQQARSDQQAAQYAQLTPFQQANFAIGRGANMLGGAIGRGLGGEDPELARITARQQISKQINYNDPQSIARAVEMLSSAGDSQGAMMLADVGRKAASEQALALQRTAQANRERQQATPNDIQIANEIASLTDAQDQLRNQEPSPERNRALNMLTTRLSELNRLTTKPEKELRFGPEREAIAGEMFDNKSFAQLLPTEKAAVNKRVEEEQGKRATKITNVMPGQQALVDIPAFRNKVQDTIKPQSQAVFAADNALANIEDSIATDNFASYRAAQTQFAKAIAGAGDLSQKELKAAGADPALLGGTADYLATLFTSTPTLDTQKKIKATLLAIKKVSSDKARSEIDAQRKIAYSTPGYDRARVDEALNFPEFSAQSTGGTGGKKTRTLASGKVVTVVEE